MLIPVNKLDKATSIPLEEERCINDLLRNATSDLYVNEKGYQQKLIDMLYKLGYYKVNESVFLN